VKNVPSSKSKPVPLEQFIYTLLKRLSQVRLDDEFILYTALSVLNKIIIYLSIWPVGQSKDS
jgi:hypothetical protein